MAICKVSGRWEGVERTYLGRFGGWIGWAALVWLVLETINIVWPRTGETLVDAAPLVVTLILVGIGALTRIAVYGSASAAFSSATADTDTVASASRASSIDA